MSVTDMTIHLMTVDVITTLDSMTRWEPDARGRLEAAALELYVSQGFEATTVADIAARAGVTERTFFRHFADKREVLFGGSADLLERATAGVRTAPPSATPLEAVESGVEAAAGMFQGRRERAQTRQQLFDATPGLQERELLKMAALGDSMAAALAERGTDPEDAALAASVGVSVFTRAFARWLDPAESRDFTDIARESFARLRSVV